MLILHGRPGRSVPDPPLQRGQGGPARRRQGATGVAQVVPGHVRPPDRRAGFSQHPGASRLGQGVPVDGGDDQRVGALGRIRCPGGRRGVVGPGSSPE